GLQARLWLTLGTRFELHPEDLSEALSHEADTDVTFDKLGVTTARDCFELAASYARKAINRGYAPLTESQWFDPTTGFNTPNNAWMLANIINSDNGLAKSKTWQSFASYISPEPQYGISTPQYKGYRLIDSRLFDLIGAKDWRKTTWIAPGDEGSSSAYNAKYARGTNLDFDKWSQYVAYTGFKFHPAQGNINEPSVGNAVSIPMMRVEEMYLIEAEAIGRAQGEGAGRALLEQFMNTYRYSDGSYKSKGAGIEGFVNDVFTQKRIEFWGEGIIMWDYKRLEMPVTRGYSGTDWDPVYRYNSNANAVAPWLNLVIPQREATYNIGIVNNPDPSHNGNYSLWE
ncbi:MAG: RagB/SusD family nutrient uptake outer membrane protein, partial [Muribaculaceae bacterium]|nr:RagB/SusD family nutrient uptake outer membrane protein [Muribaculaceae bacterium]